MTSSRTVFPGDRFGHWTVLEGVRIHPTKSARYFEVQCDCGNLSWRRSWNLISGHSKSCGCLASNPRLDTVLDRPQSTRHRNTKERLYPSVYWKYVEGAKDRGHEFSISLEDFIKLVSSDCFYCGGSPSRKIEGANPIFVNGIDRYDNSTGYTVENCVPCCSICNFMKGKLEASHFLAHISRIQKFRELQQIHH